MRVLVADDDVHVRSALRLLLEQESDVQVVGESTAAEELVDEIERSHPGVVLLDWELPGFGAPLSDLAWYLAINCRRLPESKEAAIEAYRQSLHGHGVDTHGWWDTQLDLALLGALVQFGWEKAFSGYDDELAWWERRALAGAARLPSG